MPTDLQLTLERAKMLGRMLVRDPRSNAEEIHLIMAIVRALERLRAKELS